MAITKDGGRQYPLVAKLSFGFADFAGSSGVALPAIDLPAGASVLEATLTVTTIFNSATTDLLEMAGAGITLGAADNGSSLGTKTTTALDSTALTAAATVTIEWTGVGAVPTTGAGFAMVKYIMDGKANEVQPV